MNESLLKYSPEQSAEKEKSRFELLVEIVRNAETKLGEGQMAIIHNDPSNPDYTYKIIRDTNAEKYRYPFNDASREMRIAERAREYDTDLVRTPMHYGVFTVFGKKKTDVIAMETIHGSSIKDVIEGSAMLPPDFDVKLFFQKIRDHIKVLHNNDIYHRDLHEGNIMFENETHMPVIIDFGNTAETIPNEDPYFQQTAQGKTVVFPHDETLLEEAYAKLTSKLKEDSI